MAKLSDLTKEKLVKLYTEEKRSLGDIARLYGVSRGAIYKRLKKDNIKHRSKAQARLEAQRQGKLPQQYFHINESFFNSWSRKMAYILGLIVTDGCISKTGAVSLCMNEKELLDKIKQAMNSEHKITLSKSQKGLYIYKFAREKLVEDLRNLGILPKKSLDIKFPQIPDIYLVDFIRGIFDGDGSVFFDPRSKNQPIRSKFCSGSKDFIEKLESCLQRSGLPARTIYEQKTKNGIYYMFIYGHKDSKKLFDLLYRNITDELFLERKHRKFMEGFGRVNQDGKRASRVA